MRPSAKLLKLACMFFAAAAFIFAWRLIAPNESANPSLGMQIYSGQLMASIWWFTLVSALLIIALDWLTSRADLDVRVERRLPQSLSLGVYAHIHLDIENNSTHNLHVQLTELHCDAIDSKGLPLRFSIAANSQKPLRYTIYPIERGTVNFKQTWLRITSRWGFWLKNQKINNQEFAKVYPNFAPIAQSASVSLEHQIAQMGIHLLQRRGEGSDFHQLREFREGDAMRQIDWNATSRYHKPISRDYQDERDQDVIFLLDCGRRLRGKEGDLSFFDHALNAVLLTSYIALRQGDGVGLMSFGADQQRWLTPLKHPARIKMVMNQLYDLQSTTQASDYLDMAQDFLSKRKKRALVVIITSVREEDIDDLKEATRLLSRKHMVMIASLRDNYFEEKLEDSVVNLNSALSYCSIVDYLRKRSVVLAKIKSYGAMITDSLPSQLHLKLVQEYLRLKRSGRF